MYASEHGMVRDAIRNDLMTGRQTCGMFSQSVFRKHFMPNGNVIGPGVVRPSRNRDERKLKPMSDDSIQTGPRFDDCEDNG